MKNSLEQQIINARPDDHPSNPDFVAKTMAAVKASSARETFSYVNRRMDETNKKGLFMKLRSLSTPALAAIAIAVIVIVSGTVYAAYQITHQHSTPKSSHHHISPPGAPDPTKNWTSYSSPLGKFSLRYPNTWVQPTNKDLCGSGVDRTLYLGPDTQSVQKCATDSSGQILVDSIDGDKTASYTLASGYINVVAKADSVDGTAGTRSTATTHTDNQGIGYINDTKIIQYVFYTNGTTYRALYIQAPAGSVPSQDVSSDFDLMVTKTLTFTKASPVATPTLSPATVPSKVATCSQTLTNANDGTGGPLSCLGGSLNTNAWQYIASHYPPTPPTVMTLGYAATEQQVLTAMCHDSSSGNTTKPMEEDAETISALYYGWNFATDPTTAFVNQEGC